jgi:tetratricopeptide (TPR) repeat protein
VEPLSHEIPEKTFFLDLDFLIISKFIRHMREAERLRARDAQMAAIWGTFAENGSCENPRVAWKAIFAKLITNFEDVEASYEEDYCVSAVTLSDVRTTEAGVQAIVTFLSGYEDPGKQWHFSCRWDRMVYTASKWFILNIGTFTFHGAQMKDYDAISRGIDEINKLLGFDTIIARVEKPIDAHYWGMVGTEYMKAGRFEEAEKALKESLELDLASASAWGRLVIFFNNRGRKAEALDAVEKALRYAPAGWPGLEIMEKYRKQLTG